MPKSKIDSEIELTNNKYYICLINRPRINQHRRGQWGAVFIEGLDKNGNSFLFKITHPFTRGSRYEVSNISPKETQKMFIGTYSTYIVSKEDIAFSELATLLKSENIPTKSFDDGVDYSYKKAIQLLVQAMVIKPPISINWWKEHANYPIQWNPFARLGESKKFPNARIIRSSLWTRIKDIFFILNGSFYLKNKLGVMDYFFPWPRLLTFLLISKANPLTKRTLLVPTAILLLIRTAASLLITAAFSLIVIPLHPLFQFIMKNDDKTINALEIKLIHEVFEDIADAGLEDTLRPEKITMGSYRMVNDRLRIKPIKACVDHYEVITKQNPFNKGEHLSFGVFCKNEPRAFLDLSPQNYTGIHSLMKRNEGGISRALEKTGVMEEVLNTIDPAFS